MVDERVLLGCTVGSLVPSLVDWCHLGFVSLGGDFWTASSSWSSGGLLFVGSLLLSRKSWGGPVVPGSPAQEEQRKRQPVTKRNGSRGSCLLETANL